MSTNFGRDTSCLDSLRTGQFASGKRLVAEACYRRLITPRGMLQGGEAEQNYGFDLSTIVGSASTNKDAAALEGKIRNELTKDARVLFVTAKVVITTDGIAKSLDITIDVQTAEGPFALQLLVTEVTTKLIGVEAN